MTAQTKTVALVTGANQGIGLAVARALAIKHSYHVIVASRNLSAGETVAAELKSAGHLASAIQLDLTSKQSIKQAVEAITAEFDHLDVLVNNAGVLYDGKGRFPDADADGGAEDTFDLYQATFLTNVIGTAALTDRLLPALQRAVLPRVVFVSSRMGSLQYSGDPTVPWYHMDYKGYDASKAAENVLMLNYARILADKGAKVNSTCPGLVKTNLSGYMDGGVSTEVGAKRVVELATLDSTGVTGTFSASEGTIPW